MQKRDIKVTISDITSLNEYQLRELFNYIGEMFIHSIILFLDTKIEGYKDRETKFV